MDRTGDNADINGFISAFCCFFVFSVTEEEEEEEGANRKGRRSFKFHEDQEASDRTSPANENVLHLSRQKENIEERS